MLHYTPGQNLNQEIRVNNAGIIRRTTILEGTIEEWDLVVAVNLRGVFLMSRFAIPHIIDSGGGAVVNTGSGWGLVGGGGAASYCATKAAVVNLTRAMAIDHAKGNIRVNCICPGSVNTDMMYAGAEPAAHEAAYAKASAQHPLQTVAEPAEIAHAIAYLASDKARFVTGAAWQMEGGSTAGRGV